MNMIWDYVSIHAQHFTRLFDTLRNRAHTNHTVFILYRKEYTIIQLYTCTIRRALLKCVTVYSFDSSIDFRLYLRVCLIFSLQVSSLLFLLDGSRSC